MSSSWASEPNWAPFSLEMFSKNSRPKSALLELLLADGWAELNADDDGCCCC